MKKLLKTLTVVLVVLSCFSIFAYGLNEKIQGLHNSITKSPNNDLISSSSLEENVLEKGIKLKFVSQRMEGTTIIKSFKYYVTPWNATNKAVIVEARYFDGTKCSDSVEVSVDTNTQMIDIACKEAFDKVINVNISAVSNPNATAMITLNYVQKLLGITAKSSFCNYLGDIIIPNEGTGEDHVNQKINYLDYFTPVYSSKYTKTQQYTFQIDKISLILNRNYTGMTNGVDPSDMSSIDWAVDNHITSCIKNAFMNESTYVFDEHTIWNISDLNLYHANLKQLSLHSISESYKADIGINYNVYIDFSCVEDSKIKCTYNGTIAILFQGTFADDTLYPVLVDTITTENSSIDF